MRTWAAWKSLRPILDAIDALADGRRDFAGAEGAGHRRAHAPNSPTQCAMFPTRSTGKMGYAIARAARNRGAAVTLLSGPVELAPPVGVEVVNITTTRDLYEAALRRAPEADVVIQAGRARGFRPAQYAQSKIKKSGEGMRPGFGRQPGCGARPGRGQAGRADFWWPLPPKPTTCAKTRAASFCAKNGRSHRGQRCDRARRGLWHGHQLRPAHHARGRNRGAPCAPRANWPSGFSIA